MKNAIYTVAFFLLSIPLCAQTVSGVMSPVVTRSYDNSRTGANTRETTLT